MRKIKLYIAISLNGKIAKSDGSVDWLESVPNPEKLDFGYARFYDSIDTTLMGFSTYDQIVKWGIPFPYKDKKNYVITRNTSHQDTKDVAFISENHINFISKLKAETGNDIWLVGGGKVNTMLFNNGLIDEIQVFVMPIILEDGIDLFQSLPKETHLNLVGSNNFSNGVIELKYLVNN